LLVTEKLVKEYRHRRVVNGVSITVAAGEIVGLRAKWRRRKTTTFNMVVGLSARRRQRQIQRAGNHELADASRARLGIGYLTQEPSIFRKLTVEQNILAILENRQMNRKERARLRLKYFVDELDLARLAKSKAYTLSGGEKRRLEITRALRHQSQTAALTNHLRDRPNRRVA
jgi:lipopolysaccharide export system ATP-binding protein